MMKLIAVSGKQGAGKTYLIKQLRQFAPKGITIKVVKFADPLYQLQDLIYDHVGIARPSIKDRVLLQWLGTEWGRRLDENIWVNLWAKQVAQVGQEGWDIVIITDDMRFPNEYYKAVELGAIKIRVDATREVRAKRINLINEQHPSEVALDVGFDFDYDIKSGDNQQENDLQANAIFREIFNERD